MDVAFILKEIPESYKERFTDLAPCILIPCICVRVVWRRENALRVFQGSVSFVSVNIIIIMIPLSIGYLTLKLCILIWQYTGQCHQMTQGGGSGLVEVSCYIFSQKFEPFWPAFCRKRLVFWKSKWGGLCHCHLMTHGGREVENKPKKTVTYYLNNP